MFLELILRCMATKRLLVMCTYSNPGQDFKAYIWGSTFCFELEVTYVGWRFSQPDPLLTIRNWAWLMLWYRKGGMFSFNLVVNQRKFWLISKEPSFSYKVLFRMKYDGHGISFGLSSKNKIIKSIVLRMDNIIHACSIEDRSLHDHELALTITLVLSMENLLTTLSKSFPGLKG